MPVNEGVKERILRLEEEKARQAVCGKRKAGF